uniref:Conotoxin-like protein-2 n=1 Tax=Lymantria dispar multicapsid nuclear polyhedrosis virus TaxID=10449 RepID=A0A1B1MQY2_NPVLD|nr:conotoxin-like protein-2 [Lymantria dispar multiple nucleopolyhedrovirus]
MLVCVCVRALAKIRINKKMNAKSIFVFACAALVAFVPHYALACTETGRNCKYSHECCSGACSAAFGFCLHR